MGGRANDVDIRVELRNSRRAAADAKLVAHEVRDIGDASEESGRKARKSAADYDLLGRTIALVRPAALITAAGLMAQGTSAATAGVVALAGSLMPLTGALVAYPALAGAAGQGLGVFKLATSGVTDVVGGLNEKLDRSSDEFEALSPRAQRLAIRLAQLKGPLRSLQHIAQKRMFPGLNDGIEEARKNLPVLRPLVGQTASAIGDLADEAGRLVGSKGFGNDLAKQGHRNAVWLARGGRAGIQLASALRHILIAGGPLVSWITKGVAHFGRFANEEAAAGRESGKLAKFFRHTQFVMSSLGSTALSLGRALFNIGEAGTPLGNSLLTSISKNASEFERWTDSTKGQNKIALFFRRARAPIYEVAKLVRDVVKAFFSLGNQPGLAPMIEQVRTQLLPILVDVVNSTTKAFGPHLIELITTLAKAFQPLAGSSGPLIAYVDILIALGRASVWISTTIPGGSAALTTLFGALAIYKAARFADMISGFKGLRTSIRALRESERAATIATKALTLAQRAWLTVKLIPTLTVVTVKLIAQRVATVALTVATRAWTIAQWLLNAALTANPIGLVIAGLVALAAGFVLAYKKVGWFRDGVDAAWSWIKGHWPLLLSILIGPVGAATIFIIRHWSQVKAAAAAVVGAVIVGFRSMVGFIASLPGRIGRAASGMWHGVTQAFRDAINWIIGKWNSLELRIGGIKIDPPGPGSITIPSVALQTPNIPPLATGGIVRRDGAVLVGERGPELLSLERGARVDPLPRGGAASSTSGRRAADSGPRELVQHFHFNVDGKEVAQIVNRQLLDARARA